MAFVSKILLESHQIFSINLKVIERHNSWLWITVWLFLINVATLCLLTQCGCICRLGILSWTMGLNERFPRGHCLWEPAANAFYSPGCGFRQRQHKWKWTENDGIKHLLVKLNYYIVSTFLHILIFVIISPRLSRTASNRDKSSQMRFS